MAADSDRAVPRTVRARIRGSVTGFLAAHGRSLADVLRHMTVTPEFTIDTTAEFDEWVLGAMAELSGDGKALASGSRDNTVKVWDCSVQCYDPRLISEGGKKILESTLRKTL